MVKLSIRVSLLIGILVLVVSLSIGLTAIVISSRIVEENAYVSLLHQAISGVDLIENVIQGQLNTIQELANRERTKSMDWDVQRLSLLPDVDRTGYMDLAIVGLDGKAHYIRDDSTSDLADRDYIKKALSGQQAVSDVLISRVIGKPVIMYAVPITGEGGAVLGALVGRRDGATLNGMMNDITKNVKLGESGYSFITNNKGVVISHNDAELVLSQFSPESENAQDPSKKNLIESINAALKQGRGVYDNNEIVVGFTTMNTFPWILFVTIERVELMAGIVQLRFFIILFVAAFVLVGILIAYLIARSIARPITRVADTLKDISEGEGDLTKRIEGKSKDEIGALGHYFNQTLEKIKVMVRTIKEQTASLSEIGGELASNMTKTAGAMNEITGNIQEIKDRVINQSASVTETSATMEQITLTIDKVNGYVDRQSSSVARSSSAIEQMLANIHSVTQTLIKNSADVKNLAEASEVGKTGLQEVSADIQEISRESEGLFEINAVMQNIASQTNLLSMNAAIEAAHAGESGKGFAVVADEIRKLAESSGEQSKTISAVLKKIHGSIDKITKSANVVLDKFEAIDVGVRTVSDQTENIINAMEEQGTGSKQILDAIGELNETTTMVKNGSQEMLEGSRQIITESRNLESVTTRISDGMNGMVTGTEQVNEAVHRVNEISDQNSDNIGVLVREVSKFKIE
ncbi:methyl-accepting chemotaxis protein [Treponema primitia]|uniref:methyl-accepting chemotaxis protein n=1 Tax=Treponema primitia TaxID=88058 RepID=UPI0039808655